MINISRKLKSAKAYSVTKQVVWEKNNINKIWKLDWNEEFLINPKIKEEMKLFIDKNLFSYYPDTEARALKKQLASLHNLSVDNILVYSGSDDALDDICRTYLDIDDCVVYNHPEYSNFDVFVVSNGAILKPFFDPEPFNKNLDNFFKFIKENNPKIVYLSNPNNPTGYFYEKQFLSKLFSSFPNTLFIVDEAYIHFSSKKDDHNFLVELIKTYSNLVITRTFSKLFSLAGLRLGYLLSNPYHINNLKIIHKSKNITMIAQNACLKAIEQKDFFSSMANNIILTRDFFTQEISTLNFVEKVYKSEANFICVKLRYSVPNFIAYLESNRIYVRDRSKIKLMDNTFRISILPDMDFPLKIFKNYVAKESNQ
jgi:histidinol-phosphate aminotransferase